MLYKRSNFIKNTLFRITQYEDKDMGGQVQDQFFAQTN